jgi:ribosomal protein L32
MVASVTWSKLSQPQAALATLIREGQEELAEFDRMLAHWKQHGEPDCETCHSKHAPPCMTTGQAEVLTLKRVLLRAYRTEQDTLLLAPSPAASESASADEEEPSKKKRKRNRRCKRCHHYHADACNLPKCERCGSYHLPNKACQLSKVEVKNYAAVLSSADPRAAAEVGKILNARVAPVVSSKNRGKKRKGKTDKKEGPIL